MGRRDRNKSPVPNTPLRETNVVNVVIAKNFNIVEDDVQVQTLQVTLHYHNVEAGHTDKTYS
jgi:hypothetical protein